MYITHTRTHTCTHSHILRVAQSIDLYMEALAIRRKALGRKHPSVAVTLTNMAAVWYYEGDYEMVLVLADIRACTSDVRPSILAPQATKLYTEALEIRKHNEMWAEVLRARGWRCFMNESSAEHRIRTVFVLPPFLICVHRLRTL